MKIGIFDLAFLGLSLIANVSGSSGADGSTDQTHHMVRSWLSQASQESSAIPAAQTDPNYHYTAIKFAAPDGPQIEQLAHQYSLSTGWEHVGRLGTLPKYRVFRKPKGLPARLSKRNTLFDAVLEGPAIEHVVPLDALKKKRLFKRGTNEVVGPAGFGDRRANATDTAWRNIVDPLYKNQWHLANTQEVGHDINVTSVWHSGVTGAGVTVALIDDGLDFTNEDLLENFDFRGSYDFNDRTKLPTPRLSDDYHGTRCAGQIAAARNNVCGIGVAYNAKVAGIRMLSKEVTDQDEILALNYAMDTNWIYSCSWGPNDDGATVQGPDKLVTDAFVNGVENGRGGLGSVFVFATGNGGAVGDNCNFDGYTNSIYTISIGAIDHNDKHPYYSEQCSAQLAVTYSNGEGKGIVTTDVGLRQCTSKHGGTSAAAPLAAGIYALALSVRPDLTWRDVQHLTVRAAVPVDTADGDWTEVAKGRKYNHKYGFGKMDAWRIVEVARRMEHVGQQTKIEVPRDDANAKIPVLASSGGESDAVVRTIEITQEQVSDAKMKRVEHITVTVDMEHQFRGNVEIWLKSPNGIRSQLAAVRQRDSSNEGLKSWKLMSVKHWDENPVGKWSLHVRNALKPTYTGTLKSWQLTVFGESTEEEPHHEVPKVDDGVPGDKQRPAPVPGTGDSRTDTDNGGSNTNGQGMIRLSVAALMSIGFLLGGMAVSAVVVLFLMRLRERKLASMRWIGMGPVDFDNLGPNGGPSRYSISGQPEDDEDDGVLEFEDRAAGLLSSSSTQAIGRSVNQQYKGVTTAGSDDEDDDAVTAGIRTHGNSSKDSQEALENERLV